MRKVATTIFVLVLSGLGTLTATAGPKPADQARTMSDVIDRVITNENRASQQIRQYSPLVETYIQNLRPDKDLGTFQLETSISWAARTSRKASRWFP